MSQQIIDLVERKYTKRKLPEFHVGDTVDVKLKIREGGRERAQVFNGVVIARGGKGISETFTVRRIVNNEGVERVLMLHSPLISDVIVKRRGKVRRAKLYYLRDRIGKARKVRELRVRKHKGAKTGAAKTASPKAKPDADAAEPAAVGTSA